MGFTCSGYQSEPTPVLHYAMPNPQRLDESELLFMLAHLLHLPAQAGIVLPSGFVLSRPCARADCLLPPIHIGMPLSLFGDWPETPVMTVAPSFRGLMQVQTGLDGELRRFGPADDLAEQPLPADHEQVQAEITQPYPAPVQSAERGKEQAQ